MRAISPARPASISGPASRRPAQPANTTVMMNELTLASMCINSIWWSSHCWLEPAFSTIADCPKRDREKRSYPVHDGKGVDRPQVRTGNILCTLDRQHRLHLRTGQSLLLAPDE